MTDYLSIEQLRQLMWVAIIVVAEYVAVLAAMLIDLRAGTLKARRRGEKRTSRGYRRTVDKASRYFITLMALSVMDAVVVMTLYYMRAGMGWHVPVFPALTTIGSIGLILIEVKSVMESAQQKGDYRRALTDLAQLLSEPGLQRFLDIIRGEQASQRPQDR